MEMTPKSRILAAIKGQEIDRIPFCPLLAYYFDFLPEDVRKKGEFAYLKELGADPLLRGDLRAYSLKFSGLDVFETKEKTKRTIRYVHSKGELIAEYSWSDVAGSWFLSRHPVETEADVDLLTEIFRGAEVLSEIKTANECVENMGECGLQLADVGAYGKTAFQNLLEFWVGTENLIYFCVDIPQKIEELLSLMRAVNIKTVEYTAQSKVLACITWEDSSTTNVSPSLYRQFIQPEITQWCSILTKAGKPLVQHACGHIHDLLTMMSEQNITAIESLSPPPTGNVTIKEACDILPKKVGIIGGIEPVQLMNDSVKDILEYADQICELTKNRGFVLSNSDSCPPQVSREKLVALANFVKSRYR